MYISRPELNRRHQLRTRIVMQLGLRRAIGRTATSRTPKTTNACDPVGPYLEE